MGFDRIRRDLKNGQGQERMEWRGPGIMTDNWRNIDGLVDLVLTRARALTMSERQFGLGLSIVTVTDIVTHSVLRHVR